MKEMIPILQHPGVDAFGLAILHSFWQGASIAACLFIMLRLVKNNSNLRYMLACGALVCLLMAFGYTFYLTYTPPVQATGSSVPEFSTSFYKVSNVNSFSTAAVYEEKAFSLTTYIGAMSKWIQNYVHYIFALWLLGFVAFSSRFCLGLYSAERLKRKGQQVEDDWTQKLENFRSALGIEGSVRLLSSKQVHTPLTLGWLRPVIILPVGMLTQLPYEHLESILLHELAHIKRQDYLVNLFQAVAETLLFFNPAYWYMARMIDRERENACDDMAVGISQQPMNYARALTRVAELSKPNLMLSRTTVAANKGSLTERIRRIVLSSADQTIQRSEKTKWYLMSIIAIAVLGVILITEEVRGNETDLLQKESTTDEIVVAGKVVEGHSGNPLPGINITINGEQIGTVTNPSGEYSLQVPAGRDTLVFTSLGYKTERIPIDSIEEINVELEVDVDQEINIEEEINIDLEIDIEEYLDLDLDIDTGAMGANFDSSSLYNYLYTQWEHIKKQKIMSGEEVADNILLSEKTLYIIDGEARDPKTVKPPFDYTISIPHTPRWAAMLLFDFYRDEEAYAAFQEKYPGDYDNVVILTSKALQPELKPDEPFTVHGQVFLGNTDTPVSGAKVLLKGTHTAVFTDAQGNFSIRVPNSDARLVFSYEDKGYPSFEQPVQWNRNRKMFLNWHFTNLLKKLPEIEIQSIANSNEQMDATLKETLNSSDNGRSKASASAILHKIDQPRQDPPLYIVDGKEVTPEFFKSINPPNIQMMEVIKKPTALEHYGEKGKNGVVLVTTKKVIQEGGVQISSLSNSGKPLFILDGKQAEEQAFSLLKPGDIATIDVLKGKEATQRYGNQGVNGVVVVNTKSKKNNIASPADTASSDPRPPLFIIDGIRYTFQELSNFDAGDGKSISVRSGYSEFHINLDPDDIISMEVLSGQPGITASGKKPGDVVIIKTKSGKYGKEKAMDMGPSFQEAMDKATDGMLDTMTVDEIHAYFLTLEQSLNMLQKSVNQYAKEKKLDKPVSTLDFSDDKVLYLLDGVKTNPKIIKYYNVQSIEVIRKDPNSSYQDKKSYGYLGIPNAPEKFEEYSKKYPGGYDAFVIATSKNKPKMASETDGLREKTDNLTIFPNPSENIFTIRFTLEEDVPIQAIVINPAGLPVTTLTDRKFTKGKHELEWNATGEKPGLYRIQIIQNGETTYRNVVVE